MREIKFRGLLTDGGGWVEGYYGVLGKSTPIEKHVIMVITLSNDTVLDCFYFTDIEVHPETVGQFTGLKDKNGKEIFEGDLIEGVTYSGLTNKSHVKYDSEHGCWQLQTVSDKTLSFPINAFNKTIEIIGNIHEKQ